MRSFPGVVVLSLVGLFPLVIAGCSIESTANPTPDAGLAITGKVMGGQQPLVGSKVYLLAANAGVFTPNTSGYGNASLSLLKSVSGVTTLDTSGGATNGFYYVTTDSNGTLEIRAWDRGRTRLRGCWRRWAPVRGRRGRRATSSLRRFT
jgi:hypothetical protein